MIRDYKDKTVLFFTALAVFAIFISRLLVSDLQVDHDEELYFQIAKQWANGLIPYKDIFDHKPPMVFLYYLVFSFFGESIQALRIFQSVFILLSIYFFYKVFEHKISIFFIPLLYGLVSTFGIIGTNTELLYLPFILLAVYFISKEKFFLSAFCIAMVVQIKYSVFIELIGLMIALYLLGFRLNILIRSVVFSIIIFIAMFASFYVYFFFNGVNIVEVTIFSNFQHSSGSERNFSLHPFYILVIISIILMALVSRISHFKNNINFDKRFILAFIIYFLFAYIQTQITGRGYYHYFTSSYIALAVIASYYLAFYRVWIYRLVVSLGSVLISLFIYYGAHSKVKFNEENVNTLISYCNLSDFHYNGSYKAIYRICNVTPKKYMFNPFYLSEHFTKVSGGSLEWAKTIETNVIVHTNDDVKVFSNGQDYYDFLKNNSK
jgi:hypothetical protein